MFMLLIFFTRLIRLSPKFDPEAAYNTEFPKILEINHGDEVKRYIITDQCLFYGRSFYRRLGYDYSTGEKVTISKESYTDDSESETVKILKNLEHENIEKLFYSTKIDGIEYCVFEYIPMTLYYYCLVMHIKLDKFMILVKQILDGISYLLSNEIAYKSFSEHHIRITPDLKVKLVDVLASEFNTSVCSHDFSKINNISEYYNLYWAPEYYLDISCVCKVSIWSLGILISENIYIQVIDDFKQYSILYNQWDEFKSILLNVLPYDRPWPIRALLHPVFDYLFNFLFCFAKFEDFNYNKDNVLIAKKDQTINYTKENITFSVFCCCIEQKLVENCIIACPSDKHYDFCNICQRFPISRKIKFKIEINDKIIPIQLVTYTIYQELTNLFKILKNTFKTNNLDGNYKKRVFTSKIPRLLSLNSNSINLS